jgi:hypothetical protein
MAHDRTQIEQLARTYTEAWCSHDVGRIADHYAAGGATVFNGRQRVGIEEVANYFVAAFPDGEVFMDEWTIGGDGLIADSQRHYDEAEYERQLQHGTVRPARALPGVISGTLAQATAFTSTSSISTNGDSSSS